MASMSAIAVNTNSTNTIDFPATFDEARLEQYPLYRSRMTVSVGKLKNRGPRFDRTTVCHMRPFPSMDGWMNSIS
jgi:hypothetical protein